MLVKRTAGKQTYLGLLRGVNVGGKNIIRMADLQATLAAHPDLENVRTYIQSGNVIFESDISDVDQLAELVQQTIQSHFKQPVGVAVFSKPEWQKIIAQAPKSWGKDPDWKHNLLVMLKPFDMPEVVKAYGVLKPDIEALDDGEGVLYQSVSWKKFGRATAGKLAANPLYKRMTIRNFNTATKLLDKL